MQKKICAGYGVGAVIDQMCQKWVCKISWYYWCSGQIILCWGAVLCAGRCLAASLASPHYKPIAGDSGHTQNIQINKIVGKNEKCIFCFMEKTIWTFWPMQYIDFFEV